MSNRLYFLSDYGDIKSRCVDSILDISSLVVELHPELDSIPLMMIDMTDISGTVTFYDHTQDMDVTYDIEFLDIEL